MTMVRQDDTPARRRYRLERLAVLALLALGSSFGCGREILRVPAGNNPSPGSPPPVPSAATIQAVQAQGKSGHAPVALRVDYGSTLDELFPATYRNPQSYSPQLASRGAGAGAGAGSGAGTSGRPADSTDKVPDSLLAACASARIPPPTDRPAAARVLAPPGLAPPMRPADPWAAAFHVAHIPPPRPARPAAGDLKPAAPTPALAGPAEPNERSLALVEASASSRIPAPNAWPKPGSTVTAGDPKPAAPTPALAGPAEPNERSVTLVEASASSGIPSPNAWPKPASTVTATETKPPIETKLPDLQEANMESAIAMPVSPTEPKHDSESKIAMPLAPAEPKHDEGRRTVVYRSDGPGASPPAVKPQETAGDAFEDTSIAPPVPPRPRSELVVDDLDTACKSTQIPPPSATPSPSSGEDEVPLVDLPAPPPGQVDPSHFKVSEESNDRPPLPEPPAKDDQVPSPDLINACEKTRIAPPKSSREPHRLPPPD